MQVVERRARELQSSITNQTVTQFSVTTRNMDYAANTECNRMIEFMYQLNSEPVSVSIDKAGRALSSKRSIVLGT